MPLHAKPPRRRELRPRKRATPLVAPFRCIVHRRLLARPVRTVHSVSATMADALRILHFHRPPEIAIEHHLPRRRAHVVRKTEHHVDGTLDAHREIDSVHVGKLRRPKRKPAADPPEDRPPREVAQPGEARRAVGDVRIQRRQRNRAVAAHRTAADLERAPVPLRQGLGKRYRPHVAHHH